MFLEMNSVVSKTIKGIIQLVYFMRGSVQYRDMMEMTFIERQQVSDFIETRLEAESKKMYPQY